MPKLATSFWNEPRVRNSIENLDVFKDLLKNGECEEDLWEDNHFMIIWVKRIASKVPTKEGLKVCFVQRSVTAVTVWSHCLVMLQCQRELPQGRICDWWLLRTWCLTTSRTPIGMYSSKVGSLTTCLSIFKFTFFCCAELLSNLLCCCAGGVVHHAFVHLVSLP